MGRQDPREEREVMFGDGFEQSTILRTGPDGLTRVITREVMGSPGVGARRGQAGRAVCVPALGEVSPRGAGL